MDIAAAHFKALGFSSALDESKYGFNPADFVLAVTGGGTGYQDRCRAAF